MYVCIHININTNKQIYIYIYIYIIIARCVMLSVQVNKVRRTMAIAPAGRFGSEAAGTLDVLVALSLGPKRGRRCIRIPALCHVLCSKNPVS